MNFFSILDDRARAMMATMKKCTVSKKIKTVPFYILGADTPNLAKCNY